MLAVTAGSRRELYHHEDGAHSSTRDDLSSDVPEPYTYVDNQRNKCCLNGKMLLQSVHK